MKKKQYNILKVVKKIPIFEGFEHNEILTILKICTSVPIAPGETIYVRGEPSNDMLILLKGELMVLSDSGEKLASEQPGSLPAAAPSGKYHGQNPWCQRQTR